MNEASDILIAMGLNTTQAPLLLCAVPLFGLALVFIRFGRLNYQHGKRATPSENISQCGLSLYMVSDLILVIARSNCHTKRVSAFQDLNKHLPHLLPIKFSVLVSVWIISSTLYVR